MEVMIEPREEMRRDIDFHTGERQGADASLRAMEGIIGDAKSPDSTLGASSAPSDGTGDGALSDLPSEKTVSVAADTSDSVFSVAANSV